MEHRFHNWLQVPLDNHLGDAIRDRGNAQRSSSSISLRDVYGPDGAYITTAPDYPDIIIGRADGKAIYFHTNPDSFPSVAWGSYPVDTAQYGDVTRILTNVVTPGSNSWWLAGTSKGKIIVPWQEAGKVVFKTVFSHPDGRYVKGLAASPVDPRVIYAAFVGGSKEMLWRIYLDTTDPTASVATDITYNYPANLTPMTVCADPYKVDVIYVGSKKGVMWLDPAATNNFVAWQPFNEGFPLTTVVDLVVSPADKTLLAATKGRGVWRVITGP